MPKPMTLTGNDLALAQEAAALAIAWAKEKMKGSAYGKGRRLQLTALIKKLDAISQHAYPYEHGCMPSDCGDDPIMAVDRDVVRETRKAARAANRRGPAY
jgi:hypothetical protein